MPERTAVGLSEAHAQIVVEGEGPWHTRLDEECHVTGRRLWRIEPEGVRDVDIGARAVVEGNAAAGAVRQFAVSARGSGTLGNTQFCARTRVGGSRAVAHGLQRLVAIAGRRHVVVAGAQRMVDAAALAPAVCSAESFSGVELIVGGPHRVAQPVVITVFDFALQRMAHESQRPTLPFLHGVHSTACGWIHQAGLPQTQEISVAGLGRVAPHDNSQHASTRAVARLACGHGSKQLARHAAGLLARAVPHGTHFVGLVAKTGSKDTGGLEQLPRRARFLDFRLRP
mmetsp:Transcript_103564/g.167034  ORF Transcript_103564/g.167034 Transcript_103564/m.167034 type:complete len:284 (-) Transcript_103564:1818-2669(-)